MKTEKVLTKNATFQIIETIKNNRNKRLKANEFFVEGVRNINEALKNNWQIISFLYSYEKVLSNWANNLIKNTNTRINYELTNELMEELSSKEDTSELLAIIKMQDNDIMNIKLSDNPIIALFDRPAKKANLGSILRSCDALGVELLIITGHAVDVYDPEVIASSTGSFFKMPFIKLASNEEIDAYLNKLKDEYKDFKIIGTSEEAQEPIYKIDLKKPLLFLIGNETDGLNKHLLEKSDVLVAIPMNEQSSASSFNVSCAATVVFYEAVRQRKIGEN